MYEKLKWRNRHTPFSSGAFIEPDTEPKGKIGLFACGKKFHEEGGGWSIGIMWYSEQTLWNRKSGRIHELSTAF